MELDELRTAWQSLGRQLERHDALQLRMYRHDRVGTARRGLRPLLWGQALQIAFGLGLLLLGLECWTRNTHLPALLATGVILHAFGVVNIALAALTIGLATTIDYGAPVLDIERRMARLLRVHGINAAVCGLPWWIMWVLVVVAVAGVQGVPADAGTPGWITLSLGVGVAGLVATALYAWLRRRPAIDPAQPRCDGGDGIRRSQRILAELAEFERG